MVAYASETRTKTFVGDGSTKGYAFGFTIYDAQDLTVEVFIVGATETPIPGSRPHPRN